MCYAGLTNVSRSLNFDGFSQFYSRRLTELEGFSNDVQDCDDNQVYLNEDDMINQFSVKGMILRYRNAFSDILLGLDEARKHTRTSRSSVVVEGKERCLQMLCVSVHAQESEAGGVAGLGSVFAWIASRM